MVNNSGDELVYSSEDDYLDINFEESLVKDPWWLTSLDPVSSFRYRDSVDRPFLTPKIRESRVDFSHKYKHFNWERAMFSDEHTVRLGKSRVSMWGGITKDQIFELKILHGHLNNDKYIREIMTPIVKPYIQENPDDILIHDNAPCHISFKSRSWFKHNNISVLQLPPQSSDLNLMENLWSSLRFQLEEMSDRKPLTDQETMDMINEAWREVQELYTAAFLEELYESMEERLEMCIEKHGNLLYK